MNQPVNVLVLLELHTCKVIENCVCCGVLGVSTCTIFSTRVTWACNQRVPGYTGDYDLKLSGAVFNLVQLDPSRRGAFDFSSGPQDDVDALLVCPRGSLGLRFVQTLC